MSVKDFGKNELEAYLKDLAKVYRKMGGKHARAEIVMVGGAAVLVNYNFRDMTEDIDAILASDSMLRDAIRMIRDKHGLGNDWLNDDFKKTASYSEKLRQYSSYYKTFSRRNTKDSR